MSGKLSKGHFTQPAIAVDRLIRIYRAILNHLHSAYTTLNTMSLKVIYHPLFSMRKIVTNKSKFSQDGAQVFPYMG